MKRKPDDNSAASGGQSKRNGDISPDVRPDSDDAEARLNYLAAIQRLTEIPTLLNVVSQITGMRFVVVARVTEGTWTAMSVLDKMEFGLGPGGQLDVTTTLCSEVRDAGMPIVIEHASKDSDYCNHPTPKKYGIESYIAVPIVLKSGEFFGTLCAIDSEPADLSGENILPTFELFAGLIAAELDREQNLKALTESEERYRAFVANSSEGIWRFELDEPISTDLAVDEQIRLAFERGYLAECNDAMARQYGFDSADALKGVRLGDLMVADDPRNREFLAAFINSGYKLTDAESHEKDKDGNDRYFLNNFNGVVEDGKLVRAWGSQREVTRAKLADIATSRLAAIVSSSDDAIISNDLDGTITSWNHGAEKMFGHTAEEAIGQTIALLIPPGGVKEEAEIVARIKSGLAVEHIETVRRRKDGSDVDVFLSVSPVLDDSGKVVGASKIARDITDQRRSQEALSQNQLLLTLAMQSSRMGAWERDVSAQMIWWSDELEAIFGLEPGEFQGTDEHYYSLIHEEDREPTRAEVAQAVAEKRAYVMEFRFLHADGSVRWMEGRGQAVYSQKGEPVRLYGVGIDITERKAVEERLKFLAAIDDAVKNISEPDEVMSTTARMLGDYLDVNRCAYAEIEDESIFVITGDYPRGVESIVGRWPVAAFGSECVRQMLANEPYVVNNVDTDPRITAEDRTAYRATQIESVICVPLHKGGKFSAAMAVHQKRPRTWKPDEIELVRTVVDRCWESLERARSARSVQHSNERFRAAVGVVSNLLWTNTPDGLMEGEQPGWGNFTGQSLEEYEGYGWAKAVHPDDAQSSIDAWTKAVTEKRTFEFEHRVRRHDGEWRLFSIRAVPVLATNGEVREWVGVHTDITDQRRREENSEFLSTISLKLSRLTEVDQILSMAAGEIGQHFGVESCVFTEIDTAANKATNRNEWRDRQAEQSYPAEFAISDFVTEEIQNALSAGTQVIVNDVATDDRTRDSLESYKALGIGSFLITPVLRNGDLQLTFSAHCGEAHEWRPDEIQLLRDLVERISYRCERVRSDAELRASEERFKLALSSGAVTVYEQDRDLRYLWVFPSNPYVPDVIGKTDYDISPGPDAENRMELKRRVMETGEPAREIVQATTLAGDQWFDLQVEARRDADGNIIGIGGTALNVTEQRNLQEALSESEARFRAMMEQAPFSIQLLNVDGYTIRVNRAWEELWGLTIEHLADYNMLEDPQLEEKGIAQHIRKAFAGEPAELPEINYDPDETLPGRSQNEQPGRWVSAVAYPLKGADGKVREVAIIHRDITERKEAETVLQRYRMLSEHARDVIFLLKPDGEIVEGNRAALETYGYTREELIGMNVGELRHKLTRGDIAGQLSAAAEGGAHFETIHVKKDGTPFPVEITSNGAPIGGELYLMSIVRDITERKESETVLRESQERFAKAFNASPLVVTITSLRTGKLTEVNQTFIDVTGYSREEAVGKSTDELGLWDRSVDRTEELEELQTGGSIRNKEYSFRLKDGTELIGLLSAEMLEIGGEPSALTVIQDVTERKRSEETLRRSEQRLQQMADAMPQLVWVAEPDGTVTYYNHRVSAYSGFEQNADGSWAWAPGIHPDDAEATKEAWATAVSDGSVYSIEQRLVMPDGSFRWHLSRAIPIKSADGQILQWYGTATDIHDIQEAQEAVVAAERQAAEEYQGLLARIVPLAETLGGARDLVSIYRKVGDFIRASMPCSGFFVSFFDADTRMRSAAFVWSSSGEVDISQFPPIELTDDGGPNSQAVYQKRSVIVNSYMDTMRERPHVVVDQDGVDPMSSIAVPMIVMDRVIGTFEVQAYENNAFAPEHAVALEMAANLAAVAIENVRLIEIEAEARNQAESANRAKDEFLSVLSHELRTPLNAMLGWVRMLRSDVLDKASAAKALEVIERNTRLQGSLIEDLLDVSRIISGKMRIETELSDLVSVINTVSETVGPLAAAKDISYRFERDSENIFLHADPVRLQQVISNLVQNAIKFTPAGGTIKVEARRSGKEAVLTVTDTGIGIGGEFLPYIFDRFRQADASTRRNYTGLGLGLTIARTIVELHGGTIEVDSPGPNLGSIFRVRLPLADEFYSPRMNESELLGRGGASLDGVKILLVDDDAEALGPIRIFLENEKALTETAGSASEALEKLSASAFDVLISDIGMPETDGYGLIRAVRQEENGGRPIKAIALTAYASADDREKVLAAGFQVHLAKPVNFDVLLRTIASLI